MAKKCAEKIWKCVARATYDGEVLVMKSLRSIFERADNNIMEEQEGLAHACGPYECVKVWSTLVANWAGKGKDWVPVMKKCPLKMKEVILAVC